MQQRTENQSHFETLFKGFLLIQEEYHDTIKLR